MNKQEFLTKLENGLKGLSKCDIEERLSFYSEMIDDRIEDGLTEAAAIEEIGDVESVIAQIVSEIPLTKLVKEKIKPKKRLSVLEIILLVLGSPIWLSVLISVFAVILSVYVSLWAVIICLWAVFVSFLGSALGGFLWGIANIIFSDTLISVAIFGLGFVCVGLAVFMFYVSRLATKGLLILTKKTVLAIKNSLIKKEAV